MHHMETIFHGAAAPVDYIRGHLDRTAEVVRAIDADAIATLLAWVQETWEEDKVIFVAGNGGSATVAGAWVNDLSANSVVPGQRGFRVMSLADSGPTITALGNDIRFEEVFAEQLRAWMRPGDLLIVMSCSGNSPNVLRAVEQAHEIGGRTVGVCGFDGGTLKPLVQHAITIETTRDEYGPVEDAFSVVMHAVCGYIIMQRGRMLAH